MSQTLERLQHSQVQTPTNVFIALNAKNKDYLTARGVIDPWKSGPELAHLKKKRPQSPNNPDPMSHISKKPKTKSGDVAASLPAQKQPGLEPDTRKLDGMLSKMYHLDNLERALNQPKRVAECIAKKRKLAQDILEEAERVGCL